MWTEAANVNWMESLMWIFIVLAVGAGCIGLWRRLTGTSSQADRPINRAA